MLSIKDFSFSSPCSQTKNISSIYFHHRYGLNSPFQIISSPSSAINRILKAGANFVPIAVPLFYFNVFLPNLKILFLSTTSARSQSVSLEIYFSIRLSNRFLSVDRPSSCGVFEYRTTFVRESIRRIGLRVIA